MRKMSSMKKVVIFILLFVLILAAGFLYLYYIEEKTRTISERLEDFNFESSVYLNVRLPDISMLEIPSYALAEDFPQEHEKTFNDFLFFCASVEETRRFSLKPIISVVSARLELNDPVRYEDFLAAVLLSVSFVGHDYRMFEYRHELMKHYVDTFRFASRNSFFVENILKPISYDLKTGEYRGYRFKNEDLPQFFKQFIDLCFNNYRYWPVRGWFSPTNNSEASINQAVEKIPEEFYLANCYAQTFLHINNGNLLEAYKEMYRYNISLSILENSPQILPCRPYYFYSDEERYLWFEYLQSELRNMGHAGFADELLEIETEHYRELINWQLQLRAYLNQKLYEYGDRINLSTLKRLVTAENAELKDDPLLKPSFEMAIETLRDVDKKVYTSPVGVSVAIGDLILPWIDREVIDNKQGIRSVILSVHPEPIMLMTEYHGLKQTA